MFKRSRSLKKKVIMLNLTTGSATPFIKIAQPVNCRGTTNVASSHVVVATNKPKKWIIKELLFFMPADRNRAGLFKTPADVDPSADWEGCPSRLYCFSFHLLDWKRRRGQIGRRNVEGGDAELGEWEEMRLAYHQVKGQHQEVLG